MSEESQKSQKGQKGEIYRFKIVLIGDERTGKTSIVERYVNNQFLADSPPTKVLNFLFKEFSIQGLSGPGSQDKVVLILWDAPGRYRFELHHNHLQNAACVIMVYDMTRTPTFTAITEEWIENYRADANTEAVVVLVGNKSDLKDNAKITAAQGEAAAETIGATHFMETSAKSGENIDQLFRAILADLLKKRNLANEFGNLFTR